MANSPQDRRPLRCSHSSTAAAVLSGSMLVERREETSAIRLACCLLFGAVTLNRIGAIWRRFSMALTVASYTSWTFRRLRRQSAISSEPSAFLSVEKVTSVSGQVTSSGSFPRTSSKRASACARSWFQRVTSMPHRPAPNRRRLTHSHPVLGLARQPLRMHQQRQLDLLILALAQAFDRARYGHSAGRSLHSRCRSERPRKGFHPARRTAARPAPCAHLPPRCRKPSPHLLQVCSQMLDGEGLHRHDRAGHDRRAVAAARHLTGAVLGPEGVDDLRAFVAVVLALLRLRDSGSKSSPITRPVGLCVHLPFSPFGPSQ